MPIKIKVRQLDLETEAENLEEFAACWEYLEESGYSELDVVSMIRNMETGTDKNFVRLANVRHGIVTLYIERALVRKLHEEFRTDGLWWDDKRWKIRPTAESAKRLWKFLRQKNFNVSSDLAFLLRKLAAQKELQFEHSIN